MRLNQNLFPAVWPSQIEKGYGFREMAKRYETLSKTPLMVRGELLTGCIPAESGGALHLDGILSQAVLTAHPCPAQYPKGAAIIPLPLDLLWVNGKGWPLWASGDLKPIENHEGREYWHKRYPAHRAPLGSKLNANTSAGRWREYRMPVKTVHSTLLTAVCIGNQSEIERLLAYVTHVGKKGSIGYGRIKWTVEKLDGVNALDLIHQSKALPLDYAKQASITGIYKPTKAWTPPYWYAPNWSDCVEVQA